MYEETTYSELKFSFLPIEVSTRVLRDVETNEILVSDIGYYASPGSLISKLGFFKPILFKGSCSNKHKTRTLDALGIQIDTNKRVEIDLRD